MAKFAYTMAHIPGKLLYTADALSRAPGTETEVESQQLQEEVESFAMNAIFSLPANKPHLYEYWEGQAQDPACSKLRKYCENGWPAKHSLDPTLGPYWNVRGSLTVTDNILLFGNRIVVPSALRKETVEKIHTGHKGIERCKLRARSSVWWPGVTAQITQGVQQCRECARAMSTKREPLISIPLPDYPWQVVGTDLFELRGSKYPLVVDYFSRFPEAILLSTTTSAAVIAVLKSIFARFGIPDVVRSDNGPEYASLEFNQFAASYGFQHVTSSPRYPQNNDQAERTVQTIKQMLKTPEDSHLTLLSYRATPLSWCSLSPVELLMGRQIRTPVPQVDQHYTPDWPYLEACREKDKQQKDRQQRDFNQRHRVQEQPVILDDSEVWVASETGWVPARVIGQGSSPCSYVVRTPSGPVRRNRQHLTTVPTDLSEPEQEGATRATVSQPMPDPQRRIATPSQTWTPIHSPDRLA